MALKFQVFVKRFFNLNIFLKTLKNWKQIVDIVSLFTKLVKPEIVCNSWGKSWRWRQIFYHSKCMPFWKSSLWYDADEYLFVRTGHLPSHQEKLVRANYHYGLFHQFPCS